MSQSTIVHPQHINLSSLGLQLCTLLQFVINHPTGRDHRCNNDESRQDTILLCEGISVYAPGLSVTGLQLTTYCNCLELLMTDSQPLRMLATPHENLATPHQLAAMCWPNVTTYCQRLVIVSIAVVWLIAWAARLKPLANLGPQGVLN